MCGHSTRYQRTDQRVARSENYRPVRQRRIRSETTEDEAGVLPPAVYTVHHAVHVIESEERLRFLEENNVS